MRNGADDADASAPRPADMQDSARSATTWNVHAISFAAEYRDRVFAHFLRRATPAARRIRTSRATARSSSAPSVREAPGARTGSRRATMPGARTDACCGRATTRRTRAISCTRLTQRQLAPVLFPLGELAKRDVRTIARGTDMPATTSRTRPASASSANDLSRTSCALPAGDAGRHGEAPDGRLLGRHRGLMYYSTRTTGGARAQRRAGRRSSVVRCRAPTSRANVAVQDHAHPLLLRREFHRPSRRPGIAGDSPETCGASLRCTVKTRYRQIDQVCEVDSEEALPGAHGLGTTCRDAGPVGGLLRRGETCLGSAVIATAVHPGAKSIRRAARSSIIRRMQRSRRGPHQNSFQDPHVACGPAGRPSRSTALPPRRRPGLEPAAFSTQDPAREPASLRGRRERHARRRRGARQVGREGHAQPRDHLGAARVMQTSRVLPAMRRPCRDARSDGSPRRKPAGDQSARAPPNLSSIIPCRSTNTARPTPHATSGTIEFARNGERYSFLAEPDGNCAISRSSRRARASSIRSTSSTSRAWCSTRTRTARGARSGHARGHGLAHDHGERPGRARWGHMEARRRCSVSPSRCWIRRSSGSLKGARCAQARPRRTCVDGDAPQEGRRRQVRRVLRRRPVAAPAARTATIANMYPEFGSTVAIFPIDEETLRYLELTGRRPSRWRSSKRMRGPGPLAHGRDARGWTLLELDLAAVGAEFAGPKRPQGAAQVSSQEIYRKHLAAIARQVKNASATGSRRP